MDSEQAKKIVTDFLLEMKEVLKQKKNIVFPGLGRLRSTKENNFFFVADEDLDIYPGGFGLEPISLKTHQETPEEVSDVIQKLKEDMGGFSAPVEMTEEEPVEVVKEEPVEVVEEPVEVVEEPELLVEPVEEPAEEVAEEKEEEVAEPIELVEPVEDTVEEVASVETETRCPIGSGMTEEVPAEMTKEVPAAEESKQETKTSAWLKAVIWILGTILGLLILYILASHMFPDFFDSILYSKEELEILNF